MDSAAAHASPSSHSLRQHSHFSSPSTNKIATSASTSSATPSHTANGEDAIVSIPITLDDALNAHADASDPMRATLEAILAERNSLSAQNSQLWNHLKRQRANYASAVKDVVRLRSERDALRAKVNGQDNNEGPSQMNGRKLRQTMSSAAMSSTNETGSVKDRSDLSRSGASKSPQNPRASMTRHQSDDTPASSRRPPSPSNERRSQTPTVLHSRSHEPVRGQDRERSNTHPGITSVDSEIAVAGPSTPISSNFQQSGISKHAKSASVDVSPNPLLPVPTPLIIPPRDETPTSMMSPASGASSAVSVTRPLNFSPRRDRNSPESAKQTSSSGLLHPAANVSPASSSPINLSPDDIQVSESRSLPPATHNTPSIGLSPNYHASVASIRQASRESRISLPDEAKRFIANMGESPLSSPHTNGHPENWSAKTKEHHSRKQASEDETGKGRPFLDLEDDSDIDPRASEDTKVPTIRGSDSELDIEGTEETAVDFDYTPKRGALSGNQQTPKVRTSTTADQFPLPPSTFPRAPSSPTVAAPATIQTNLNASTSSRISSSTLGEPTERRSRDKNRDSFVIPENMPEAKFRQMPLLNTDVKSAKVQVVGSHIRANDRGKEVLSFVVQIDVPGKEGWTIEKFYSDVLGLDSRLRSLCSRATLKKLSPLPDNKLFKDHAPAKVDQRKQVLQTYLQSVMALPIKDKNEIIVFFSTDIMRERSPVTKSGYKEGYLTKRGKNFGGWKTRYFVLQGPVLEYYESRGGTHLGSIPIVGAQIGRQQRMGDKKDSDDENDFRHAFLILERKRGPGGQVVQHVLCCESDAERDAWVDVLMRYVMGTYNDEDRFTNGPTMDPQGSSAQQQHMLGQPRTSTSSLSVNEISSTPSRRSAVSKDSIQKSSAQPIPISQLSQDKVNAKFFQAAPIPENTSSSPGKLTSPIDRPPGATLPTNEFAPKSSLDRFQSANSAIDDTQLSSSVPTSSNLDAAAGLAAIGGQRAASELGYYPDMPMHRGSQASPEQSRTRERGRASFHPTLNTVQPSPTERPISPDMNLLSTSTRGDSSRQVKISAPVKATPILDGQAFGGRASSELTRPSNDRERKAKSRTFWGFGRTSDKQSATPILQPRAVFGVSLEESLAVSQQANLPAIIYRCIQYLEAKHAEQEEGIYRLSGSSAVIKSLKDRFNAEGDVDLLAADEDWDPHAIAGLLKSFLRELPSSILTHDLHSRFLGVIDLLDVEERIKELQELISQLPYPNYCLLRALTAHLILIVQNSNINKMTMRNVGIVFSPTLGIAAGVFSLMMSEYSRVFNLNGEGTDSPEEGAEAPPSKRSSGLSRRNSKRYSDAAVDQVLGLSGRTLPVTEEDRSDEDDIEETESDVEDTTEAETENQTVESSAESTRAASPVPVYQEQVHPPPSNSIDVPQTPKSRASNVAASRGLNINVVQVDVDGRRPRMAGLPTSPRPSPLNTPTSGPNAGSSPSYTPR
ncbi:RhoGAP-domain-containing protein [Schizopora paradoxa]|uniref:RhoGAP-domain-containing protein n=1 Tax=Schizopora paradoxa TaxID=27342 RepID=A0A0H2S8H9_9AGAM|nr:RhoGAP-domain-containing protein [Schizopora paradoxa]